MRNGEQGPSNVAASILNGMRRFDFLCLRTPTVNAKIQLTEGTLHHLHRQRMAKVYETSKVAYP
jgi:hypothetical protein